MRLFSNANYKFLDIRRRAYVVSAAVIAVGLGSILLHQGFRMGVEFTGGKLIQARFQEETDVATLRDLLASGGFESAQIQGLRGGAGEGYAEEYVFRVQTQDDTASAIISGDMERVLQDRFGEGQVEIARVEAVSPKVGSDLRTKAIIALLLSFGLTLIYLAFRFEWRFGVAAVIATVHDIMITGGLISLFGIEITLATVAAILTIIGYSLNDTIVVFDRVRENLKKKRKESYQDTLERSINETLPRTVLTSGTTLAALFALFILGGAVIRPFAAVLIIGVIVGTYSSIFVASAALLELHDRARERAASEARAAHASRAAS